MRVDDEFKIDDFYEKIGKNVAIQRKKKGISQLKMAMIMGLNSVSVVASSETYKKSGKHFNLEHIHKISKILEIDYNTLLK